MTSRPLNPLSPTKLLRRKSSGGIVPRRCSVGAGNTCYSSPAYIAGSLSGMACLGPAPPLTRGLPPPRSVGSSMQLISASILHLFHFVDDFPRPFSKASEGLSQYSYIRTRIPLLFQYFELPSFPRLVSYIGSQEYLDTFIPFQPMLGTTERI